MKTADREYTSLLLSNESRWWKKALDVQAPYRWNLRRLEPGFVLDIGCGIGRNLINLAGNGVGIDHNPSSVQIARSRGLEVFGPEEFRESQFNKPARFDSMLLSHVAEHMIETEVITLLRDHLGLIRPEGKVIVITPQEAGFRSDVTHVRFIDFAVLRMIAREAGLTPVTEFSFPFPRFAGRFFKYNEFVFVGTKA